MITIYTFTWNEPETLKRFINWYRRLIPDCNIVVYDNQSDDNTIEIAENNKCEVFSFDTNDQMDEKTLIYLRNNVWKEARTPFVLVVDSDELVHIDEQKLKRLLSTDYTIFRCIGYEMLNMFKGVQTDGYSKPVLFRADKIEEVNFAPGSHNCDPKGTIVWNEYTIPLYHTKWIDWDYGIKRQEQLAKRRSKHSKEMGWNFHYELPIQDHANYVENLIKNGKYIR